MNRTEHKEFLGSPEELVHCPNYLSDSFVSSAYFTSFQAYVNFYLSFDASLRNHLVYFSFEVDFELV